MITSQIDTAPKLNVCNQRRYSCLITSQIDTAPKRRRVLGRAVRGLITSQIDTAPKQAEIHSEANKAGKNLSAASRRQIYTGVLDRYYSKTLPKYGFDYITRNKGYNYNR